MKESTSVTINIRHDGRIVRAILIPFPQKSIIKGVNAFNDGVDRYNNSRHIEKIKTYKNLKICIYGDLHWIYYGPESMTGSFDSKKKCIEWFEGAGR